MISNVLLFPVTSYLSFLLTPLATTSTHCVRTDAQWLRVLFYALQ